MEDKQSARRYGRPCATHMFYLGLYCVYMYIYMYIRIWKVIEPVKTRIITRIIRHSLSLSYRPSITTKYIYIYNVQRTSHL